MSRPGTSEWHSYFWPGTTILRNKLEITDPVELQLVEFDVVETRSHELRTGAHAVDRTFDSAHLKAIHAHLFGDLYDWAGHYRTVNISKTNAVGHTNHFGDHASMDMYLRQVRAAVDVVVIDIALSSTLRGRGAPPPISSVTRNRQ